MMVMYNLPELHAKLKVGLPESKCSPNRCPPYALVPYAVRSTSCGEQCPIAGTVKTFNSARDVNSHFASDACSHRACASGKAAFSHCPFPWGMGCNPMIKSGP